MKKLILSTAILLGSLSTFATPVKSYSPTAIAVNQSDEYTEIKIEEVPAAVTESLKKAYPDAVITKAYVNEKKEYRLDVKLGDKEGSLFADETGKWLQN
ncbi:hypothetical protein [Flavobacterium sp. UMI-01]|uniref:hypothetical protein n=1 Tax=Flavobacterium sp. UMI-01 TaxID=1441053 RepID=UPI001C7D2589|nr:hypothetical protein [Flavobacterium sp. UMI-01]GIZ07924.1 hypothetical protein FUMI01_06510 [Flavobacterium sp. UMI-01]